MDTHMALRKEKVHTKISNDVQQSVNVSLVLCQTVFNKLATPNIDMYGCITKLVEVNKERYLDKAKLVRQFNTEGGQLHKMGTHTHTTYM